MSSPPAPEPLYPRKPEPIGWFFEDIRFREDPIPETWWFIPWINTEYCEIDEPSSYPKQPASLLYYETTGVGHYRGSGIVVEEIDGTVIGCYKIRADTEAGDEARKEVEELKAKVRKAEAENIPIERIDKHKGRAKKKGGRTAGLADKRYEKSLRMGDKNYDGKPLNIPNQIRRLNGLIIDPRPSKIALHREEAFFLHEAMGGCSFKDYGAQYPQLEYQIRNAMKDTFDVLDLPIYRQKQIKAAEKAGRPEKGFTDEQSSSESEEEEVEVKEEEEEEEEVDLKDTIEVDETLDDILFELEEDEGIFESGDEVEED
ncbi:uncharacterized protein N0V89_009320 [Didymosphaeria variabile]|uniref:Uncharacterized protein n=1 Tax=Didymosphaeria variabile TaxID=1932322 RepID=A0A9W8XFB5_9PLEO|nr:uncharacterized protein N0V89_009320 [Didymosphaeria variabile]KAJ4347948.1 hypothetical protein N0V89_009320 [Didymosphaeria variabile]